jgi:hypothetical protein
MEDCNEVQPRQMPHTKGRHIVTIGQNKTFRKLKQKVYPAAKAAHQQEKDKGAAVKRHHASVTALKADPDRVRLVGGSGASARK